MAEDWAIDVRKYAPDADDGVIKAIVRHCGIALQSRDASLVSFTDPEETGRVRENFCRKKLGLTLSDAELDSAIARVGERMSGDTTRNRVTVYYLLAEMFGKLGLFGATEATAMPAAAPPAPTSHDQAPMAAAAHVPAPPPPPAPHVAAAAATAAVATPAAAMAATARAPTRARPADRDGGNIAGTALTVLGALAVIILAASTAGMFLGKRLNDGPAVTSAPAIETAAPVAEVAEPVAEAAPPAAPAIPTGSGVVAQDVEGKPQLSVYFDTASAEVSPDFAAAAAAIKAYVDANPGARLAVSGYNDPRGDAAFNAELSKNRAQSVAAALTALGVPAEAIDLEKPAETTDTTTSLENARRVDIMVKES